MLKRVLFIAATHGNEAFSVPVLKRLESRLDKDTYSYDWIIGNPLAYEKSVRFIDTDMNRAAPGDVTSTSYEDRRVAELLEIAKGYEIVIDIHGSLSDCGVTTLIPKPTDANLELAKKFGLQNNIIWESTSKTRTTGPIVQFINGPAIELECGPKQDDTIALQLEQVLERFIKDEPLETGNVLVQFYEVYGKLLQSEASTAPKLVDFTKTVYNNETFYPYLAKNTYKDILCYKMKKL